MIILVALIGNCFIGAIAFKTKSMGRTIDYLIVNMTMSDLLLPIFTVPRILTDLYAVYSVSYTHLTLPTIYSV